MNLAPSAELACTIYDLDFLVKTDPCKHFQTALILTRFRDHESVSTGNRVRVNAALEVQ